MVPAVGLEPTLPLGNQILSLTRLPLRHAGIKQDNTLAEPIFGG